MTRCLPIVVLCLLGGLSVGCIHLEQRVKISANGAGVVTYDYSVAEETFAAVVTGRMAIDRWHGPSASGLNWFTSEAAVREFFSGDEFEVQYFHISRKGGRRLVRVVLLTPDLQAALATGKLGDFRLDQTPSGDTRFRRLPPAKAGEEKPLGDKEVDKLRALCDDLWLQLVVETPGDIVSATSEDRKAREVTWTFDPGRDDSFLRKRPEIEVVYKRKG